MKVYPWFFLLLFTACQSSSPDKPAPSFKAAQLHLEIRKVDNAFQCVDLENGAQYQLDDESADLLKSIYPQKEEAGSAKYYALRGGIYLLDGKAMLQIDSLLSELVTTAEPIERFQPEDPYEFFILNLLKSQLKNVKSAPFHPAPEEPFHQYLGESELEKLLAEIEQNLTISLDSIDAEDDFTTLIQSTRNALTTLDLELELMDCWVDSTAKMVRICSNSTNFIWKESELSPSEIHASPGLQKLALIHKKGNRELIRAVQVGPILRNSSFQIQGRWVFDHFTDSTLFFPPGMAAQLSFNLYDSSMSGHLGCNKGFANFQLSGASIEFQSLAVTQRFCMGSSEIENHLLKTLRQITSFRVNDCYLELGNDGGTQLVLRRSIGSYIHD